jgi:hypothetical protein
MPDRFLKALTRSKIAELVAAARQSAVAVWAFACVENTNDSGRRKAQIALAMLNFAGH